MGKKIAIINSVCGTGSTGRISNELAVFLIEKGYDARIFFGRNTNQFNAPYAHCFSNRFDVLMHALGSRLFDKAGFLSKTVTKKLTRKLDAFDPDLLILNNLHGYYLNVSVLFNWIKRKNKKTILICHDCWNLTGHCAHFDFIKCDKWKKQCYCCPAKTNYPKSVFLDMSRKNYLAKKQLFSNVRCLTVVSPSNWLSNIISKSYLGSYRTIVINNGVDTTAFKKKVSNFRVRNGLKDKKIILCIAYVFDKRKGIDDILQLSEILGDDEVIVLVGHVKVKIEAKKNNIIHIEQTDDLGQLVDLYSTANVMFNPTYEDTFSNTNMEALSCGTPVVCYRTGGAYEMLDEKYIVKKGDYKAAYEVMKSIFKKHTTNPNHPDFSKESMHNKYLELIQQMLL